MISLKINKTLNIAISALLFISLMITLMPTKAAALSGGDFDPANIISDTVFYNSDTMSAHEIQAFLNSKVPVCDTWHAPSGGTSPPYTCLKDYTQSVPNAGG